MRRALALALLLLLAGPAVAAALTQRQVVATLARESAAAGGASGVYVENLATGKRIFARSPDTPRIPASVEKLWTTTAAQATFSDDGTLATTALTDERVTLDGTLDGDLYLRGSGDPTLTTDDLDELAERLADDGLSKVTGRVIGDDTAFDAKRGVPSAGFAVSVDVAPLGALMVNRGVSGQASPYYQPSPARFAANAFTAALRAHDVTVRRAGAAGRTPQDALALNAVESPPIVQLIKLQNVPSDNYIAEMLLKAVGAAEDEPGTTAHGAATARDTAEELFDLTPTIVDGSGLSRRNASTPREVVDLLAGKFTDRAFFDSLAIAGRSGTLLTRLRGRATNGNCRGKTGTLSDVSNLAGYCRTPSGDTLAFAILNNRISPYTAHGIQDRMVGAIARYDG